MQSVTTEQQRTRTQQLLGFAPALSVNLIAGSLALIALLVLLVPPTYLRTQEASWLTFLALVIAPGYLLGDLLTWRLDLDGLERLAIAFPLGMFVIAVPGMVALLQHLTIQELAFGWGLAVEGLIVVWILHSILVRKFVPREFSAWEADEVFLLLLLLLAFVAIMPTLSLAKIDGDAYAVGSFVADAVAGLPLNVEEPLFGTGLGPGVRMVFNQSLPLFYLWSYLSRIDAITLTASASRAMIALWALLASYMLGKAAGGGSRRFGLFTAAIQFLIYLAAPFLRGDNVSLFFFERINADKFMVPVTMLPIISALAIRYVREPRWETWLVAAIGAFAVATIHPLIAAMLALALSVFGGLHLLLHVRSRAAWVKALALGGLVAIVMSLPLVQLFLAHSEEPLAATYPQTLESWPVGQKTVTALPFFEMPTLDLYGPLPEIASVEPRQAETDTNPFLMWRFAVNMARRRLILFDLTHYISDPNLILEPPYLLALLLLPLLLWRLDTNPGAQFAVSTTLGVLFIMFNPLVTPLIGELIVPWILWRMVWLLPYALVIALATRRLLRIATGALLGPAAADHLRQTGDRHVLVAFALVAAILLSPLMVLNLRTLTDRAAFPSFFPTPVRILDRLRDLTANDPATVLADDRLSVTIPAYVARAHIVAHRAPTTSEIFPANRQDEALERLIDQAHFFGSDYLTIESLQILERYRVRYVVTSTGSNLDTQLRLAPQWFTWQMDDQSYSLYTVRRFPTITPGIYGNTLMAQRRWEAAQQSYEDGLDEGADDPLALVGLADAAYAQGQFDVAFATLTEMAEEVDIAALHYRLGQLYADRGQMDRAIAEFRRAQSQAPLVARYHLALADTCLNAGEERCAATHYEAAVATETYPDKAAALVALADLWQRRGRTDRALPYYQRAVALRPDAFNQFLLVSAYRDLGEFDQALDLLRSLQISRPFSPEVDAMMAALMAAQGEYDTAVELYRRSIWLLRFQAQDATDTRLALADTLLQAWRLEAARAEISGLLQDQPFNAVAYKLQGDLNLMEERPDEAAAAYQRALELDPTQVAVYASLIGLSQQVGTNPDQILELLQEAVRATPGEPALFLALGDQLQRRGRAVAAIEAYQSTVELLGPSSRPQTGGRHADGESQAFAYARLAAVYEDLGQVEEAMNYYHAAVAAAPGAAWSRVLLGDALVRRNDLLAAEEAYYQALQRDPTDLHAYLQLGALLEGGGDETKAVGLYDQALRVALATMPGPDGGQALATLKSYCREVNLDPTFTSDEAPACGAIEAPSFGPEPRGELVASAGALEDETAILARLFQKLDRLPDAIQLYRQRIEQGEADHWPASLLARSYKALGDLHAGQGEARLAAEAYLEAIERDEWWVSARLGLAEALAALGDPDGSLAQLRAAVELAPGSVEAQLALARALDERGDDDEALSIYVETATAHPGNPRANLALARGLEERRRWDEAEESYRQAITMSPGRAAPLIGLANLYLDQGRYDEAERLLHQAEESQPGAATIAIAWASLEQRRGNRDAALAGYNRVALEHARDRAAMVELIDALIAGGYNDKALTLARRAINRWPEDSEFLLRYSKAARTLGRYADAQEALERAARAVPSDSTPYIELAGLALIQGESADAVAAYEQAIHLRPYEESYVLALSQIWTARGNTDKAYAVLQDGVDRVDRPAPLYAAIATIHLREGRPTEALALIEEALDKAGPQVELYQALGNYYNSLGKFDSAEAAYREALALQPDAAAAHVTLADLYLRRNRPEEALTHYKRAVQLDPADPTMYLALARAYRVRGESDSAISAYSQALALAPTLVNAYTGLASLYSEAERAEDARAAYERGLAVAPASGHLLARYALFLLEQQEAERAAELLDRAVDLAPSAETLIARARLFERLERPSDAEQDLRHAVEMEEGSTEAWIALGDLYLAQEVPAQAKIAYERVIALAPGSAVGYLRLARLAYDEGEFDEARRQAEMAARVEPSAQETVTQFLAEFEE